MSYQVGAFCYASLADAGSAACASFAPVTSIVNGGASITTISCQSATDAGALNLMSVTNPTDGSSGMSVRAVTQYVAYQPCQEAKYWEAGFTIVGAVLGLVCISVPLWRFCNWLVWGRGESA